jgi:hypothetical protein
VGLTAIPDPIVLDVDLAARSCHKNVLIKLQISLTFTWIFFYFIYYGPNEPGYKMGLTISMSEMELQDEAYWLHGPLTLITK